MRVAIAIAMFACSSGDRPADKPAEKPVAAPAKAPGSGSAAPAPAGSDIAGEPIEPTVPLPKGMTGVVDQNAPKIQTGGVTVDVLDEAMSDDHKVDSIALSKDGRNVVVKYYYCWSANGSDHGFSTIDVPLARIEARVENLYGMRAHLAKRYEEAIPHFATAAAKDPDSPVFATNLLSAQSLANKLDDAEQTIDKYGKNHPGWFAWRFAVDPELANVKAHTKSPLAAAPKRGHVKTNQLRGTGPITYAEDRKLAYSAAGGGLVAAVVGDEVDSGTPFQRRPASLAIAELPSERELLRLPLESPCISPDPERPGCSAQDQRADAARFAEADELLAKLGFDTVQAWDDKGTSKIPGGVASFDLGLGRCSGRSADHLSAARAP